MPKVRFINELVTAEVPRGAVLRDVALQQGVEIYRGMWTHINCRGNGVCGRCLVWIVSPEKTVSQPSLRERFHRLQGRQRLACQVRVIDDLEVRTRPLGPAVILEKSPQGAQDQASYKQAAEERYRQTIEEEQEATRKKAAEAQAKAQAEAQAEAEAEAKAEAEAPAEGTPAKAAAATAAEAKATADASAEP